MHYWPHTGLPCIRGACPQAVDTWGHPGEELYLQVGERSPGRWRGSFWQSWAPLGALGRQRAGEGLDWLLGRCDSLSFPTTCCLFNLIPPSLLTDLHEAFLPFMDPRHHVRGLPYSPSLSLQESTSNIKSAYILWPPNTSVSSDFSEPFGQRD